MLEKIELLVSTIDYSLGTKRRQHIIGGVLLSMSFLFGGLAFTAFTLKDSKNNMSNKDNYNAYVQKCMTQRNMSKEEVEALSLTQEVKRYYESEVDKDE